MQSKGPTTSAFLPAQFWYQMIDKTVVDGNGSTDVRDTQELQRRSLIMHRRNPEARWGETLAMASGPQPALGGGCWERGLCKALTG